MILDLELSDGDGERVLELLREKRLRSYVVVSTGLENPERLKALQSLEPDVILNKPSNISELLADFCRIRDDGDTADESNAP